jgi:hypothetical protein
MNKVSPAVADEIQRATQVLEAMSEYTLAKFWSVSSSGAVSPSDALATFVVFASQKVSFTSFT